jgi:hypothetical protein
VHRGPDVDIQTIWYRAPEVCRKKREFGTAIDMWSLGCIMAELCGQTFHQLRNMSHQQMLTQYAKDWACIEAMGRAPWPAVVRVKIGTVGEYLLDALLSVEATSRPSAREAVGHQFLHPTRMVGHSVYRSDDKGLRGFLPAASCDRLPGERHPYSLLSGNVGVEVLEWLRMDFMGEDSFGVDFQDESRKNVKVEEDRKFILGGKLTSLPASTTMCTLNLNKDLPTPRLRAFFDAFKVVNSESLRQLQDAARAMTLATMPQGEDDNREHFLEHTLPQWFCTAGELTITNAEGVWKEADHMDGGASVLHMGVTVYGDRDMACHRPGFEADPVVVRNTGGTVYLGVLTGPRHGVSHLPSPPDQLWPHRLGQLSVTIMMRTTLFPHCRSRLKGTTPSPSIWYGRLAENLSASLSSLPWELPLRAACEAAYAPPPASVPKQLKASPAKRIKDELVVKAPEPKAKVKAEPLTKHQRAKRAKH